MGALYSKYRPKVFADVVGQKQILQTLQNAVNQDKISHAYMFCGPRGTGKTTMARLLAKACMCKCAGDGKIPSVNFCGTCQDCNEIATGIHPDVYELDAASRTGVENVREEIIGRVGFAATRGEKKIYIIDEVHMLSTAAFNALLKTLEEPPQHVIFILCTTDPQKVPETILSRCQRFNFNAISADDIFERLKYVCTQENVNAEDQALEIIAKNAQGAMRNALTNLEQVIAFTNGQVSLENLNQTMSAEANVDYALLIENLGMRNLPGAFEWIDKVCNSGIDFSNLLVNLTQIYRDMYVKSAGSNDVVLENDIENHMMLYSADRLHRILIILNDLQTQLKTSANPRLTFEIACAKIANPKGDLTLEGLAERIANLELVATAGDLSPAYAIEAPTVSSAVSSEVVLEDAAKNSGGQIEAPASAPKHIDENQIIEDETDEEEVPRKVVKVIKDQQAPEVRDTLQQDAPQSEIKIPQRPVPTDFSQERQNLKKEANIEPVKEEQNISVDSDMQKLWHAAFSKIKNKYPAFGATLLTATPSFDNLSNQFILKFPGSASFSVGVLKKPESMEKIHAEIKEVMGKDIGFNIAIDDTKDEGFNPQFENNFRKPEEQEDAPYTNETFNNVVNNVVDEDVFPESPEVTLEEATDRSSLTDMLSNMGAFNITEE